MKVPEGFIAKLWSFIKFLPFFILLFILGIIKALIISPIVAGVIGIGNSSVIIGLWPAHFFWTCYCVVRTKKLGMTLKIAMLLFLPAPLIIWPVVGVAGSFVGGIGFGLFSPLIATFEAVGENVTDKFYHCFIDGCWPTIQGSCTVVRDFTDFCFHSYFSYMDELLIKTPTEEPVEIKLSRVPGCLVISLLALLVDVPSITVLALWKSPYMLFTGWKRLLEDFLGREGPFLESVCVPFGGLAIILWPLAVICSIVAAFLSSFFLALNAGVVAHQEKSLKMGLAYVVAVVSLFDEYANDLLYLEPGSCLPRPRYRKNVNPSADSIQTRTSYVRETSDEKDGKEGMSDSKLISQRSRTIKAAIQHYKPIKVLDWLFKSCEVNGRKLLHDGLINVKDIEECVLNGDCKKLGTALPAWCIMQCLLDSAKSDSPHLVVSDEADLTITNWPRDKMFLWLVEPLLVMKEQIRKLKLEENEEVCLQKAIMESKNERPEDWNDIGFPSEDNIRRAQLQSVIRRLQGIVGSMTRMPTFRRRFQNLVKVLYVEAAKTGALVDYIVDNSAGRYASGSMKFDEASEQSDAWNSKCNVADNV